MTMKRNKDCTLCELHTSAYHNPCVWGEGPKRCPLMFVGEAPGFSEDAEGRPFVGEAGKLLNFVLNKLGVLREKVYVTNLLKCRPPKNELPKKTLPDCVMACWPYLVDELHQVRPKVVVTLGGTATEHMTGKRFITKWEGSVVKAGKQLFVPCFHPAYVLRSPSKEANMGRAIAKACELAGIEIKPKGLEAGMYEYEIRT